MTSVHHHKAAPATFWLWFATAEARFRALSVAVSEEHLDELLARMQAFCPSLFFEVGGAPNGPMELVISAGGDRSAFPCVGALVASAPPLAGWVVIAFKQPQGFDFVTERNGVVLDPRLCHFQSVPHRSEGSRHWLRVACPGFRAAASEDYAFAVWTALETALGEVFVADHVREIELCAPPSGSRFGGFQPLPELRAYLLSPPSAV
jgi:hypothetical protein